MKKELLFKAFKQKCKNEIILILREIHFFKNSHTRGIRRIAIPLISCLVIMFCFSSCATIVYAYNDFTCPVYFDINSNDLANTQFFIDGKPIKCKMVEFSATQVASGYYYNTFKVTSKPAIKVNPVHKYYTLTVKNEKYGQKDILLKRNIADEVSGYLFLDLLTGGYGTLIDVLDNSLMKLPSVDMEKVASNKNATVFYNTKVQIKLTPSSVNKNK